VLLIVLCGGGLFMLGLFGYRAASQVAQSAATGMQEQMQQMAFAAAWQPPAPGSGPDVLFPPAINAWQLAAHDDQSAIVELALERDGLHARYESGVSGVDVYAYEVPPVEQSQIFNEAAAAIENVNYSSRSQGHVDDGTSHRLTFSFSPPDTHGRMWWSQGWLFVLKTSEGTVDLDAFLEQYLTAIRGTATTDVPSALPADDPGVSKTAPLIFPPDSPVAPEAETAPDAPAENSTLFDNDD
jgi:hypothetical protein